MNNELIQRAVAAFIQIIGPNRLSLSDEEIDQHVDNILPLFQAQGLQRDDFKHAVQAIYATKIEAFRILEGRERRQPWLKDFKAGGNVTL